MLVLAIILTLVLIVIGLILYSMNIISYNRDKKEEYSNYIAFSQGSQDILNGTKQDYFYQLVPLISKQLLMDVNEELDRAEKTQEGQAAVNEPITFTTELQSNTDIKTKYIDSSRNLILPSTKLAIFLGLESYFNINGTYASNQYANTSTGKSKTDLVNHLIKKYFQNFNLVNALDAYTYGILPVYPITSSTNDLDQDTLVSEGALILAIIRQMKKTHSDLPIEKIPSFSASRVYQSTQDRLEAKCSLLFRLINNVSITKADNFKTLITNNQLNTIKTNDVSQDTKMSLNLKLKALEQTQAYREAFIVALMRSINEKTGTKTDLATMKDSSNDLTYFASRTGVSSNQVSNYEVVPASQMGSGYVPNTMTLLGDTEPIPYKQRLRDAISILMKNVSTANSHGVTQCSSSVMNEQQHCSTYSNSREDSDLAEHLVYYVMGIYKDGKSKGLIEAEAQKLKSLSQNDTTKLSEQYIKQGLFTTDELVILNNIEHRSNFVGPYTASMRHLISNLSGVSGNATLREDLVLFDNETQGESSIEAFEDFATLA